MKISKSYDLEFHNCPSVFGKFRNEFKESTNLVFNSAVRRKRLR